MSQLVWIILSVWVSSEAKAAGGLPPTIDFYSIVLDVIGQNKIWIPTVGALLATLLIAMMGVRFKSVIEAELASGDVTPTGQASLTGVLEGVLAVSWELAETLGEHARSFFPFLSTLLIFILMNNLMGLVPGFPPATGSMDTNVAMGLIVFVVYNVAGLKVNGVEYLKHFAGPVIWIAPLFVVLEILSNVARPFSLGFRLTGNLFADHTLLAAFTMLTKVGFPAALLFFGLLVAVVQSYVFTLLTSVYIGGAVSHDH